MPERIPQPNAPEQLTESERKELQSIAGQLETLVRRLDVLSDRPLLKHTAEIIALTIKLPLRLLEKALPKPKTGADKK